VPIAPHTLSNRPIVLADPGEIAIEIVAARDASASFDMQSLTSLHRGDRIIVRRSSTACASCTRGLELLRHPAREAALEQGKHLRWLCVTSACATSSSCPPSSWSCRPASRC
jgi:hypothetical protein